MENFNQMIGKNIGNEDLIAIQLLEEMRMDLNDIPYADEYKEQDPWKNYVRIQA